MVITRPRRRFITPALALDAPLPIVVTCAGMGMPWPNGVRCSKCFDVLDAFGVCERCERCLREEADQFAPLQAPPLTDAEEAELEEEDARIRRNDDILATQEEEYSLLRLQQECPWLKLGREDISLYY